MTDMAPLRVLHIIATLRGGGAETFVRELLPRLQVRGVDVAVLSAYEARLTEEEHAKLTYPVYFGNKRGRFDAGFPIRTIAAIRRLRPHIVHTHTITGKYWGRACAAAAAVKRIVHTEHSPQQTLGLWEFPFARALVGRTDTFITFSPRTAAFITQREPVSQIEIIPNGIVIEPRPSMEDRQRARESLSAPGNMIIIGIVANLQPQKNQQLAIDALARLSVEERSCVRLDLFGTGPNEAHLRAHAKQAGVAGSVKFWGFRADVRRLLAGLDMLLSVSLVEAAPISLLEAMSAALPIIGTPHHGMLDLVVDGVTGIIIPDWSIDSVAQALRRAIADPNWCTLVGEAGRRHLIQSFSIETVADRHVELYERISPENERS